jgi:hypothetical protein
MDFVKAQSLFQKYKTWLLVLAAFVFVCCWLGWLWYGKTDQIPAKVYHVAKPATDVANMAKVDHVAPVKIKVLPKSAASKKLDLPADIAEDDNQQIIDTADIAPAPHGATTVTVMDTTTGESKTLVKAKPAPLFAFLRTGAVGARYGIASTGDQQAAIFVRQDLLRVANIHLSATIEARTVPKNGTSEAFGAVEVSYRWGGN